MTETNPVYGPFFGVMGAASAIIFSGKHTSRVAVFYFIDYVPFKLSNVDPQLYLNKPKKIFFNHLHGRHTHSHSIE